MVRTEKALVEKQHARETEKDRVATKEKEEERERARRVSITSTRHMIQECFLAVEVNFALEDLEARLHVDLRATFLSLPPHQTARRHMIILVASPLADPAQLVLALADDALGALNRPHHYLRPWRARQAPFGAWQKQANQRNGSRTTDHGQLYRQLSRMALSDTHTLSNAREIDNKLDHQRAQPAKAHLDQPAKVERAVAACLRPPVV